MLELLAESNTSPGTITAEAVGGTAPYTINILDENLQSIGFPTSESDEPSFVFVDLPDGTYCLEITDASGCTATSCVLVGPMSTGDLNAVSFQLHPNPASDAVQLTLPAAWDVRSITLRDATGRSLATPSLSASGTMAVSSWPEGIYFIEVQHTKGTAIERVVVRR